MSLQNRVTPWGEIVAIPDRGAFTGNRGVLHDGDRTIRRRWVGRRWIVCLCVFQGRRRTVMSPGRWTELFFLDEATALAAGHRPCFFCRRPDGVAFRRAWAAGNGGPPPRADTMDAALHAERLDRRAKRLHAPDGHLLPDGAMLAAEGTAYVILAGTAHRWTPAGYGSPAALPRSALLLTPPSTVRTLRAGYPAAVSSTRLEI